MSEVMLRLHESVYERKNGATPEGVATALTRKTDPVTYDLEEGFLTHFEGLKHPRPAFLNVFALRSVDNTKKYLKSWLSVLARPTPSHWLDLFDDYIESELSEFFMLPEHMGRVSKEVYRLGQRLGFRMNIVKGICTILDQDLGYRWPLQDLLSAMDAIQMKDHPIREAWRIINVFVNRCEEPVRKVKFMRMGRVMILALILSPALRKRVKQFAAELDTKRIILGEYDLYSCLLQKGYSYLGLDWEHRVKLHQLLYS